PASSPREYAIPIFTMPLSIPPALGTPNGGHKQSTPPAPTKQKTSIPIANLAPSTMPDHTVPVAATSTGEPATTGNDTGSDQPKGVPWGVKDGIGDGPPSTNVGPVENDVP